MVSEQARDEINESAYNIAFCARLVGFPGEDGQQRSPCMVLWQFGCYSRDCQNR
jgi:hypothetical protein